MKIALLLLFLPVLALADSFTGKVVAVTDGDTIKVLRPDNTQEKIRLLGIDAPEKKQDFGQKSKEALIQKIAGQTVTVEYKHRDRYGRLLGKILKDGRDINLSQIQDGLAWHYKQYAKDQGPVDAAAYAAAEEGARGKKFGLWAMAAPQPPWEFRHPGAKERKVASKRPKGRGHQGKRRRKRPAFSW
jgi:endonuclease YncB( thermonuclease family)